MKKAILILFSVLTVISCSQQSKNNENGKVMELSGAGATFPLPYYNIVFKDYTEKTKNKVTYGGIGSGGGIRSLKDQTVDFGATDAFLTDKELQEMNGEILHIPTCMGAVVLAYNLPDVKDVKLTGELVSDIFLGKVTQWNDSRIQAINPGLTLPAKNITAVYRSDGSGTTYVFTEYLAKVSEEWNEKMGAAKSLKWPVGVAAKGNPGVAGTIREVEGSIGYIGSEYSLSLGIPTALLQNSAGNFIEANTTSISAAAKVDLPADMRAMITNSNDPEAYPISCFTWIILNKEQAYAKRNVNQAKALSGLMEYMLSPEAQAIASKIHYSPLPENALKNAKALVNSITFDGQPVNN